MALDGITIANIVFELEQTMVGGRIDKIAQPEKDEVVIHFRSKGANHKLLLTASASHPRLHLSTQAKDNPMQAPLFCMVLRKHITSGKITGISQPNFERIVNIHIDAMNEMGDVTRKTLVIEIMGKHSNIMLLDDQNTILDAIKHITFETSSVREVLPGKAYTLPPNQGKQNPLLLHKDTLYHLMTTQNMATQDIFVKTFSGISPFIASDICFRAGADPTASTNELTDTTKRNLCNTLEDVMNTVQNNQWAPTIYYKKDKPMDFTCVPMARFATETQKPFDTVSAMLAHYYSEKDTVTRVSQKNTDIRKLIMQNLARCHTKHQLYTKTQQDIKHRDQLKIKGELLTANIYALKKGMDSFTAINYHDPNMAEITIPLDKNATPSENAQHYYRKYNKQKRTFVALQQQMAQNDDEIAYLETLLSALATCLDEGDMEQLRDEMSEQGFAKRRKKPKGGKPKKPQPLHFVSVDGFHIYVGKNNKQNDELTLRFAENLDLWLHTKDIPGSHVIVRTGGQPVPDTTLAQAVNLAAFYSKARASSNVPVDYTPKKNVKKPSGAKPGMVIYDHHQTAHVTPTEPPADMTP